MLAAPCCIDMDVGKHIPEVHLEYPGIGRITFRTQITRRKVGVATKLELLRVPATTHIIITYPLP